MGEPGILLLKASRGQWTIHAVSVCASTAQITSRGRTHTRRLLVELVSLRAPELGNRLGRSLAIKLTYGKRATLQAVTRVKLEQASKVVMWTPTRHDNGEGSTDREETGAGTRNSPTNEHLVRSTGVVSTACREGDLG